MAESICAYCGLLKKSTQEHVVPRNLFDIPLRGKARFVKVPTCSDCNGSYAHDEEHFRNVMMAVGSFNPATENISRGPMTRSFRRDKHGKAMLRELLKMIMPGDREDLAVNRIHIDRDDERITRVVKKITRGLCFKHLGECVPEGRVWALLLPGKLKEEFLKTVEWIVIHPQVCRYCFVTEDLGPGWCSGCYFEFFQTVGFLSLVDDDSDASVDV